MKIYQVLSSFPGEVPLRLMVNEALKDGWELAGGVGLGRGESLIQAMWKEVDDDPSTDDR
jgi:hypothetical protein